MSPPKHDYYETLGVRQEGVRGRDPQGLPQARAQVSPRSEPRRQVRRRAFQERQEAYDVLSDPKKRQMYDQFGFYSENGFPGAGAGGAGQQGPHPNMDFSGFDFSDFFGGRAGRAARRRRRGSTGDRRRIPRHLLAVLRRTRRSRSRPEPEKGGDLEYVMDIDFWQAIRGTQARLNITRYEICATCHGIGLERRGRSHLPAVQRHRQCHPDGRRHEVQPHLPALRRHRQAAQRLPHLRRRRPRRRIPKRWKCAFRRARATARGCACPAKATPAPWARLPAISTSPRKVEEHPFFRREGDNIEIKVPVAVWEAALGAKIEVPTIDGRTLLKIPQGTQNGQKFRLREKGVFNSRTNQRGDQIVEVAIEAPESTRRAHHGTAARTGQAASRRSARGDLGEGLTERSIHGASKSKAAYMISVGGRAVRHPSADAAALRARRAC